MVILQGESLLNDASALLIYRVALGAVAGGAFSVWSAGWLLVLSCVGGAAVGFAAARLYMLVIRPAHDIAVSVVTQFVGTFAVWLLAERLGVSPGDHHRRSTPPPSRGWRPAAWGRSTAAPPTRCGRWRCSCSTRSPSS